MPYPPRGTGAMGDYELLAEWFAGAMPVALAVASAGRRLLSRLGGLAFMVVLVVGILTTGTRGGAVASIVGVIVFLLLLARRSPGRALQLALILVASLSSALLIAALVLPNVLAPYVARFNAVIPSVGAGQGLALQAPFELLARALNRERWLGLPSFITAPHLMPYGFFPLETLRLKDAGFLHALWLTIWFQGGIIGTAAWIWLAVGAWWSHHSPSIHRPLLRTQVLSMGLVAGLAAMLTSEVKVEFLRSEHLIGYFFLMLGLSIAVSRIATRASAPAPREVGAAGTALPVDAQRDGG